MTIASSTTRPTESTMASSVKRLMVKPATSIRKTAPTSETGMATTGISTERNEPRNKKRASWEVLNYFFAPVVWCGGEKGKNPLFFPAGKKEKNVGDPFKK